ncbi:MAG: hypothetical protein DYG90_00715 [Chloroflexi bacterium CFX6]|nr:hypothetical protein [Chloroflexi bacterium CFX6]
MTTIDSGPTAAAALALATFYVAYTAAYLDGPFGIAYRLRVAVWDRWPVGEHWLGDGVGCPVCIAFWAAPVMLALSTAGGAGRWAVAWLAIAGGATAVHLALERRGG